MNEFSLKPLPYAMDALAPHISAETLSFHHGKHHQTYVSNLNNLIKDTEWQGKTLIDIIRQTSGPMFNNAAQVFNHDFYWQSLSPSPTEPSAELLSALKASFNDMDNFKEEFTKQALANFGSGWTWLVQTEQGLKIVNTANANCPLTDPKTIPLLTCDVWEHAYYIDYHNARAKYLEGFWALCNWQFASLNFKFQ